MKTKKLKLTAEQKLKARVAELEREVAYQTRLKDGTREELSVQKEKVEDFERQERNRMVATESEAGDYRDQVLWLRDLVESIVVPVDVLKVKNDLKNKEDELMRKRRSF